MKLNTLFTVIMGVLAWLGLPSCMSTKTDNLVQPQGQQEIKISGSGSAYWALKILATAYEQKYPNIRVVFNPSSKTSEGVRGVKEGIIDIGVTSRELAVRESNGIEYRAIALDPLAIATHKSVTGIRNLQAEQLQAIYRGEVKNWRDLGGPDAPIVLLDRAEDEGAKILLRRYYLGQKLRVTSEAMIMPKEKDVIKMVDTTYYSVGLFSLVRAIKENLPVNHLNLDEVAPTLENVRNGKYKMVRAIGIVWKGEPEASVEEFIEFLSSQEAAKILEEAGYVAIAD